ncbi:chaperonin cpn60-like 2 mitochondrial [Phtheirospermum japonicum]|uniref:Chaperonin cpn60-like 2 mitochondrial n=1 Tax=Phtheirospermum japonicum TaxID=374723 RepID=A0A830D0X3_9LAMI|nr:chaperonin cpn60-like 2 mitochondrial [Phtheirospermum japonicum]
MTKPNNRPMKTRLRRVTRMGKGPPRPRNKSTYTFEHEEARRQIATVLPKGKVHIAKYVAGNIGHEAIYREGSKSVAAGVSVMDLRKGINLAVDAIVEDLKTRALMISSPEEITQLKSFIFEDLISTFLWAYWSMALVLSVRMPSSLNASISRRARQIEPCSSSLTFEQYE